MRKLTGLFIIIFVSSLLLSGCLNVEKKAYTYKVNADGSGSGSIEFINIISQEDEERDVSLKDFGELIDDYLQGNRFESDNPQLTVTSKELYEENGKLNGKVEFTFKSLQDINFLIDPSCNCAPIYYYLGSLSETYLESNGEYLGTQMNDIPIVKWKSGTTNFSLSTEVTSDLANTHSLLPQYKEWKKK